MRSLHGPAEYLFYPLSVGASGYVLKSAVDQDLVNACRAALRGEPFLYPAAVTALIRTHLERRRTEPEHDPLSPREQEVVRLIAEGMSGREIADRLAISPRTVERHRANLLQKLGLQDRVEVTRYAIRRGLIEP
jgi:DNA-binding NarL/FixJ family response regulator